MKKYLIFTLVSVLSIFSLQAQTEVELRSGSDYQNDIYYSFSKGEVKQSPRHNWDIAFQCEAEGMAILVNHGIGCQLYTHPTDLGNDWEAIDTTGMHTWEPMYNSTQEQFNGAFNQNAKAGDYFDHGWGRYLSALRCVKGDSLFILNSDQNMTYKIKLHRKEFKYGKNYWVFDYGDMVNKLHHTLAFSGDAVTEKHFFYLDLDNYIFVDREPAIADWDLQFTRYYDPEAQTRVSGVLANSQRVELQAYDSVDQTYFIEYDSAAFQPQMDGIGYNWKQYDAGTGAYILDEDKVYFAKVNGEQGFSYWKLYFTHFSGSAEGIYRFVQEEVGQIGIAEHQAVPFVRLSPNPAQNNIQLLLDYQGKLELRIYDMSGKLHKQHQLHAYGFSNQVLDISQLPAGVYTLQILTAQGKTTSEKFIKL